MRSVAVIGSGPTGIYFLKALLESEIKFNITLFEQAAALGTGTPYCPTVNSKQMLANISSIEIPNLLETYCTWLHKLHGSELEIYEISKENITERGFYPRILLGKYFQEQLIEIIKLLIAKGHKINIQNNSFVRDVDYLNEKFELRVHSYNFIKQILTYDHVVMATGHYYDKAIDAGNLMASPWPYKKLNKIRNCKVGILGTSLSAIDAFIAVAHNNGSFLENETGELAYNLNPNVSQLDITMMSRKGILPEADFFCPLPYEPLEIFTEELVQNFIDHCQSDLLDETFHLFKLQLLYSDPDYAASISLEALDLQQFNTAYFSPRINHDPFVWAADNLRTTQLNYNDKKTVQWRYAILRMHETFGQIVPHLTLEDLERFNSLIKPIFVDDYASVPHQSIKRILAAHKAGILNIKKLPEDYVIGNPAYEGLIVIKGEDFKENFDYMIDATGNKPLSDTDFPFQSISTLIAENETGLELDDHFRLCLGGNHFSEFYCLSIPHILDKYPFIQGIEGSYKLGTQAAEGIVAYSRN